MQITKIRNRSGNTTTNLIEIKRIIRKYYEQLYANKLDNLSEMDAILEIHKWSKLTQEEIDNLNRSITCKAIARIIKNLPTKKSPRPEGFPGEFYQTKKK